MTLPNHFYTAEQVKVGEIQAAKLAGVSMFDLMRRAGKAVFELVLQCYPTPEHVLVCCGGGNNGGDGFVLASLVYKAGIKITVWSTHQPTQLTGDAYQAYCDYVAAGGKVCSQATQVADDVDVIVDALLGTGLCGEVKQQTSALIQLINASQAKVIAVDIPSGLCADTGVILGTAVQADHTISFIGMKQGLVTGKAREYSGSLHFSGLGVELFFQQNNLAEVHAITEQRLKKAFISRNLASNKGHHGKALLLSGDIGFGGAIILSAAACARTGAGLTAVLTHSANYAPLLSYCPEVMCHAWDCLDNVDARIHWATAIALGPGLGMSVHAKSIADRVSQSDKPKVVDADGLNLLALAPNIDANRVMTPHPGEAARLLNCPVKEVEQDRYQAVRKLQQRYGGVAILKGAGTLVCDGRQVYVCLAGNPGMASGGMGDVLTGVIVSLLAQGYSLLDAALIGVQLHSQAADQSAKQLGCIGLQASDLIPFIRIQINRIST